MAWSAGISLKGADGAKFYPTATTPTDQTASAKDGDYAFAADSFQFYQRQSGTWTAVGTSVKGPKGDMGLVGQAGTNFIAAMSTPTSSTGNTGDVALLLSTGEVFGPKGSDGSWPDSGYSLKGAAGLRGTQTFYGSGAPPANYSSLTNAAGATPQPGDNYYDTSNGQLVFYVLS